MTRPTPGAVTGTTSYDEDADRPVTPCQRVDPELFFPDTAADAALAKRTCRRCEILDTCLRGALEREEPWGVWGGELFVAGKVVRVKRRQNEDEAAA